MARANDGDVSERLDRALRLLAMLAVRDFPQREQIAVLDRVGFEPREIAEILGTTSNTVRVTLVGIRRAGVQGRRKRLMRNVQEDRSGEDKG